MSFKSFALLIIALIVLEGVIAVVLSHGINGHYFKSAQSNIEALSKLRADKPRTATAIGVCYVLILAEFFLIVLIKFWR